MIFDFFIFSKINRSESHLDGNVPDSLDDNLDGRLDGVVVARDEHDAVRAVRCAVREHLPITKLNYEVYFFIFFHP